MNLSVRIVVAGLPRRSGELLLRWEQPRLAFLPEPEALAQPLTPLPEALVGSEDDAAPLVPGGHWGEEGGGRLPVVEARCRTRLRPAPWAPPRPASAGLGCAPRGPCAGPPSGRRLARSSPVSVLDSLLGQRHRQASLAQAGQSQQEDVAGLSDEGQAGIFRASGSGLPDDIKLPDLPGLGASSGISQAPFGSVCPYSFFTQERFVTGQLPRPLRAYQGPVSRPFPCSGVACYRAGRSQAAAWPSWARAESQAGQAGADAGTGS